MFEEIALIPAEGAQAFSFTAYQNPDLLNERTLVVGFSTSGETEAVHKAFLKSKKKGARTALLRKLKDVFRQYNSQPVDRVICVINPMLRGWVDYFRVGHSSRCFAYVRDWVEKKLRRHLMRARKLRGFGWNKWSRAWLYETLRLYSDYVDIIGLESAVSPIGRINLEVKFNKEAQCGRSARSV